ncbi:MAG: outer membrane protein assembly factor BamD, partial [Usitatibacteraceae bacterium]
LSGCSFFGDKLDPKKNWSAEEFYKNAREELDSGNYSGAVKAYEALEAKYPFGRYAQQSQLDIAYAYYKDGETAQATAAADRFLKLHPNHPNADYALYIKALAYFKPDLGLFGELLNLDPAERDPKALRESFEVFKELITRFPESRYTDDSRARMSFLVNALAKHEVAVARYYLGRGAPLAAVNRAQIVFQRYPQAPAIEDALVVSVQAYEKMSMPELATSSRRVLEKNFPNNDMVSKTPNAGKPWWKLW